MSFGQIAGTLWYLQSRSWVNAVRQKVQRLRQPKYLIGAVLGLGYLLLVFGRWIFYGYYIRTHGQNWIPAAGPSDLAENTGAAVLLGVCLMNWFFAGDRAALAFTEAETAFLFPAPLSRPMLITYRLLRGQGAILMSTVLLMIFSGRVVLGVRAILPTIGWWLVLSLLNLHSLGASFAVQRLTERGLSGWQRRLLTVSVPFTVLVGLWFWYRALPAPPSLSPMEGDPLMGFEALKQFGETALTSGPAPWLLWPFRIVVRPLFAASFVETIGRLLPAVGLLALHTVWVLRSAVSFEEASLEKARRSADQRQKKTQGQLLSERPKRIAVPPFELAPVGHPWVALWWRGLLESRQRSRTWAWLFAVGLGGTAIIRGMAPQSTGVIMLAWISVVTFVLLIFIGANQGARRVMHELRQLDVVKAFPVPGWQVILGAALGGITGLVLWQWLLLGMVTLLLASHGLAVTPLGNLWMGPFLASGLLFPAAMFFAALLSSVPAILFPAWFVTAKGRRGFENSGQVLFVGFLQLLLLLLALLPPTLLAVPTYLLGAYALHANVGSFAAGVIATATLLGESALLLAWLGRRFEALDSAAER